MEWPQEPCTRLTLLLLLLLLLLHLAPILASILAGGGASTSSSAAAAAQTAVPASLQLLLSKATEAPQPGAGTAIKNLSAHVAQGMLFQAAQQRAQKQQEQEEQQQQLAALQDSTQQAAGTPSQPRQPAQPDGASAESSSAPQSAQSVGLQDVLAVLVRLEHKVDRLTEGLQAGLQQLDSRLRQLEAAALVD